MNFSVRAVRDFRTEFGPWIHRPLGRRQGLQPGRHLRQKRRAPRRERPGPLIGHLDTVFEKDSPFQRFEKLPDRPSGPRALAPPT